MFKDLQCKQTCFYAIPVNRSRKFVPLRIDRIKWLMFNVSPVHIYLFVLRKLTIIQWYLLNFVYSRDSSVRIFSIFSLPHREDIICVCWYYWDSEDQRCCFHAPVLCIYLVWVMAHLVIQLRHSTSRWSTLPILWNLHYLHAISYSWHKSVLIELCKCWAIIFI